MPCVPDGSEPTAVGRQPPPRVTDLSRRPKPSAHVGRTWRTPPAGPTGPTSGKLVRTRADHATPLTGHPGALAQNLAAACIPGGVADAELVLRLLRRAQRCHGVGPRDSGMNQGADGDDGEQGPAQIAGGDEPGQAVAEESDPA